MLKELIAIGMATTLMTAPPQNTNDGTYYQDVNITETYEFETNEVNNVSDLVVGNIYSYTIYDVYTQDTRLLNSTFIRYQETNVKLDLTSNGMSLFYINGNPQRFNAFRYDVDTQTINYSYNYINLYKDMITYPFKINFVYVDSNFLDINNISASDYLGEKTTTVEPVETEGLYNLAYHFLYSRIYTNTELQGMETTLFGTTINMNMWLSHTTAIVIICLLLIVLIKFVIWLFKIVSGGMLWQ